MERDLVTASQEPKPWTWTDVPRPPQIVHGNGNRFPAHAEVGPVIARRIADLLAALIALEAPDLSKREGSVCAVPMGDGVIAIYSEESMSDTDPEEGLVGWVQQVDAAAWCFAGYARDGGQADG